MTIKQELQGRLIGLTVVVVLFGALGLYSWYAEHQSQQQTQEQTVKVNQYNAALQDCYQQYVEPFQRALATDPYMVQSLTQTIEANTQSCQNSAKQYLQ